MGSLIFLLLICLVEVNSTNIKVAIGKSKSIYRIKTNKKVVALTFDDGPDPRFTLPILDTLKEYQTPATIFMVGNNVKTYPDIVKRVLQEGHEIRNHTMTHPELPDLTQEQANAEIESCSQVIAKTTGKQPIYFRPPKGLSNDYVGKDAASLGMRQIFWSVTIENSSAPTPQAMAERVLNKVEPGNIILLHDGRLDRTKTVKALPLLLKGLKERGYQVISLSEMLQMENSETNS